MTAGDIATMKSPCWRASAISSEVGKRVASSPRVRAAGDAPSGGRTNQQGAASSACGSLEKGWTLSQPLMPQASTTRPTSSASVGQAGSCPATSAARTADANEDLGGGLGLRDQALDRRRHLRAVTGPVLDAVERHTQRLFGTGSDRVVEADALDEAAVPTQ